MGTDRADREALAGSLSERIGEIARASVDAQYAEEGASLEAFGRAGYEKSLEDARYNLEVLAEALAVGDYGVFSRHVLWLDGILRRAKLPEPVLPGHLERLGRAMSAALGDEGGERARACIAIALRELRSAREAME